MVLPPPQDRATAVRRAQVGDAGAIADVFLAARATMRYLPELHSEDETRAFIRGVVDNSEAFVAIRDDRVVGFLCVRDHWLEHLYVHPDCFNKRVGTQLLEHAKVARPAGFQLWVFQDNDGARRFYERHGCRVARLTDGHDNEENLPDALYVWPATREPSV
jgi:ribosomal protein S18 acetylase RimI-like enzyme